MRSRQCSRKNAKPNAVVSDQNLTPDQRAVPRHVLGTAFRRIPQTCQTVREILDEASAQIMRDLEVDQADGATLDAAVSFAFQQIRDRVTQPFRTEQVRLLLELREVKQQLRDILEEENP